MLPPAHRMHRSSDFTSVVRGGTRARGERIVVHHARDHRGPLSAGERPVPGSSSVDAPLVGLIVSKAVGGSVVRHRVSRRLRAQLAQRLVRLPDGSATVVRALPGAAAASSAQLGADLDRALSRLAARR